MHNVVIDTIHSMNHTRHEWTLVFHTANKCWGAKGGCMFLVVGCLFALTMFMVLFTEAYCYCIGKGWVKL